MLTYLISFPGFTCYVGCRCLAQLCTPAGVLICKLAFLQKPVIWLKENTYGDIIYPGSSYWETSVDLMISNAKETFGSRESHCAEEGSLGPIVANVVHASQTHSPDQHENHSLNILMYCWYLCLSHSMRFMNLWMVPGSQAVEIKVVLRGYKKGSCCYFTGEYSAYIRLQSCETWGIPWQGPGPVDLEDLQQFILALHFPYDPTLLSEVFDFSFEIDGFSHFWPQAFLKDLYFSLTV